MLASVSEITATSSSDVLRKEFDSKVADSVNHLNTRDADAMSETGLYFGEKLIPRDSEPLKWWHEHGKNYPKMSKLARKYLCATATSVPSERLFSKAGELVSHRRSSLKPKNVNMLLFLNQNI
ncbi:zinc finger BED domain-containing 1-like [Paramuricea clavata]|uniref:Zinc finger BED domain-containing 1-like n=2 Tax=Paramuricea clavata TaxID=317549 RepID=A0A6S7J0T8_PARCT|nr:zinc finger BED domain-containing 1-like [Paramuricea clavata]